MLFYFRKAMVNAGLDKEAVDFFYQYLKEKVELINCQYRDVVIFNEGGRKAIKIIPFTDTPLFIKNNHTIMVFDAIDNKFINHCEGPSGEISLEDVT